MDKAMLEQIRNRWAEIGVGRGEICRSCPAAIKRPLLPWQIGGTSRSRMFAFLL